MNTPTPPDDSSTLLPIYTGPEAWRRIRVALYLLSAVGVALWGSVWLQYTQDEYAADRYALAIEQGNQALACEEATAAVRYFEREGNDPMAQGWTAVAAKACAAKLL